MSVGAATIELTREELYQRVWSTPMSRLAAEFGLSDVGLAKVCKRHRIPRPSRGYWAKLERGKKVEQWPLMPTDDESLLTIRLHKSETPSVSTVEKSRAADPKIAALIEAESSPENHITPLTDLHGTHPLVAATREALSKRQADEYGRVSPSYDFRGACFDVRVSKPNVQRALLILHSLLRAFKNRGYHLGEQDQDSKQPYVEVLGRRFRLSIWEASKRQKRVLTKQERTEKERDPWRSIKDYEYVPSGVLELHLDRGCYSSAARVCDTQKMPLEQRLNQLIVCMLKAVDRAQIAEEQRRREAAEAEIVKLAAIDREIVARTNDVRVSRLLKAIPKWEDAVRIGGFIRAVRAEAERRLRTIDESSEIGCWLSWAESYLASIDPLADTRQLPTYSLTPSELDQLRKECESDWCDWSKTFRPRQPR